MTADDGHSPDTFLLALLALVGALSLLLVVPFLQPILAAGLLAYLVVPVRDRLVPRLGSTGAVVATMVGTVIVVLVPLAVLLGVATDQAVSLVRGAAVPDVAALELLVREVLGPDADLSALAGPLSSALELGLRGLVGRVAGIVGALPAVLVGSVVFLFAFFYLLRDGEELVDWLRTAAPLDRAVADELVARTDDLLWAAVVGNVVVAALQAVLTVLGFAVLGFDDLVFWSVVTFVLSLLPLVGASIVWIPAVAYLVVVGRIPAAVGLAVYGSVVVSGSDNVVRPLAMQRGARLNSGLLVVGIFGGVAVFGFVGLFVGPVVLGLGKELVEIAVARRGRGSGTG